MSNPYFITASTSLSAVETNKVLRQTYMLLSMTLLFSAMTAALSMALNAPPMGFVTLILYMGLLWATSAFQNSGLGILCVFALTGTLGFTLGPMLNFYLRTFHNGGQLVLTALGGTGMIFLGLSAYTLTTRKDFSYMAGFLMVGFMTLFVGSIAGIFFHLPLLQVLISCGFLLLSSGAILMQTSAIIHGGERNYIMATVSLYVSIFNIFVSLLQILGIFGGNRE